MIVGIDGEGQGRADHRYMMLAASDCTGDWHRTIEAQRLGTKECLDFILDIPKGSRVFSYGFNYDITKLIMDMDDKTIYLLMRPQLHRGKKGVEPIKWEGYLLNLQGTCFTVKRGRRTTVIWDIIKFFQSTFVKALTDWKAADLKKLERMADMKNKRSEFDKEDRASIREYCQEECRYMATLAAKLIRAHEDAGLPIKAFYGAGTTGGALLKSMGIDKAKRKTPEEMEGPVARSFSGGRFENGELGVIRGPILSADISSAYPYQLTFLPCLDHGEWSYTTSETVMITAKAALVNCAYHGDPNEPWAPLFFRTENGSICYPYHHEGGWYWRDEYLSARDGWEGVKFKGAWVFKSRCEHFPFAGMPNIYRERLRIGKNGPGIVFKLGPNSSFGKLAQSVGKPKYQCWIWASMVPSGCRAMINRGIMAHRDRRNLKMIATDGMYTTEMNLKLARPRQTGTGGIYGKTQEEAKPLGGWELERIHSDMFAARPGIYFRIAGDGNTRGRGLGRSLLNRSRGIIASAFASGQESVMLSGTRFHGAKSSISMRQLGRTYFFNRSDKYGQWRPWPIEMTFNPLPKRKLVDGVLKLRRFDGESAPYKKMEDNASPEKNFFEQMDEMLAEQPEGWY